MKSIAQQIHSSIFDFDAGTQSALIDAAKNSDRLSDENQDWDNGATIFTFDDNSRLIFCGSQIQIA